MDNLMKQISIDNKTGIKLFNALFMLLLIFNFCYIYLNDFTFFKNAFRPYIEQKNIVFDLMLLCIMYFFVLVFFSYDSLLNGNNRFSKIFHKKAPSIYLMETYNIKQKQAEEIWYSFFDKLHNKEITISRGFSCRFVFSIFISLCIFFIFAIASLGIEFFMNDKISNAEAKILNLVISGLLTWFIYKRNNPDYAKPTGVWKKFIEINELHIIYLQKNAADVLREIQKLPQEDQNA